MATKKTTQTEQPVEQTVEQPAEATAEGTTEAPAKQEVEQPAEATAEGEVIKSCNIAVYNEVGQRLLAMHPKVNEVYVTSDGYAFLSLNAAKNNARNLRGNKVFIVKRSENQ